MEFLFFTLIVFLFIIILALITINTLNYLIPKYVKICINLIDYIICKNKKIQSKLMFFFLLTIHILFTITFLIYTFKLMDGQTWAIIAFILYPMIIIFVGEFLNKLYIILEIKISNRIIKGMKDSYIVSYIINRVSLLFERTFLVMTFFIVFLYVMAEIFVQYGNDTPIQAMYLFFLMIPIFLVLVIYIKPKDEADQNIRRIISYLLLFIILIINTYQEFKGVVEVSNINEFYSFFTYIVLGVFAGVDNCIKSIMDDYKLFKNKRIN